MVIKYHHHHHDLQYNPKDESSAALRSVLDHFDLLQKPHYHMLGNHCLYNLPRPELNAQLGISSYTPEGQPEHVSYYSFEPHPEWRFVVLDAYDISVLGWPEGHPKHQEAVTTLRARNPNAVNGNMNSPEGLEGIARRFVVRS